MSAFLGPIHHWLYNKIKFQDELTSALINLAKEKDYASDKLSKIDKVCGELEKGDLADLIDTNNIHGWLQERIIVVEKRLAYTIKSILDVSDEEAKKRLLEVENCAFEIGRKYSSNLEESKTSPSVAYRFLEDLLVNGMPCDRVNLVVEEDDNSIKWQKQIEIHSKYWELFDIDVDYYYAIRNKLIEGILFDSDLEYISNENENFEIKVK